MKIALLLIALLLSLTPLVINIFGKNVYLNIYTGGSTVVIGASNGVLHLSKTTELSREEEFDGEYEDALSYGGMTDIGYAKLLDWGPFELTTENRLNDMQLIHLAWESAAASDDYAYIDFPLILIPLAPLGFFCLVIGSRKVRENRGCDAVDGQVL